MRPAWLSQWKSRALAAFAVLLALVWAAPIIVGYTPLVGRATAEIEAHIDGKIQVSGVSLGWFSPVVLYDVVVRDADNQVLAHIPRVEGDRALFKLLLDQNDLGSYRLDKAKIDILCKGNSSNLERVFVKVLRQRAPQTSAGDGKKPLPQLHLETVDATLTIQDDDAKQAWTMRAVSLSGRILDQGKSAHLNLHGSLHDGSEPGTLKMEISVQNLQEPSVRASAKGKFTALPIALANVIARRYQPGLEATGSLQGNFQVIASLKDGKPDVQAIGEIVGNQIALRTPQLADTLRIQRMSAPCTVRLEAGKLFADRLEIDSEFGKVSVQGCLDLDRDLFAAFDQAGFELALDINLATLAERLPKTFHLHPDLRLTAGQLQVKCKSVASNGGIVWQGKLHTSEVRGIKGRQTIAWSDPITLDFQVRDLHKGFPIFDSLQCSARFLRISGTRSAEQYTLTAEADLQQLAEPLGQFIDLDGAQFAGKASAKIMVRHVEKDSFTLHGDAQFQNLNFAWFTKQAWQEPLIVAKLDAHGSTDAAGRTRVDQGNIEIRLGSDIAVAQWTEPIADLVHGPWGTAALRFDGDLTRWHDRARSWTTALDDCQLAGLANVQLRARLSADSVEFIGVNVQASNLRFAGKNAWINEPNVSLTTAGRWNVKAGQLALTQSKLTCPTMQVDSPGLTFTPATLSLRGSANFHGDLACLQHWARDPKVKTGEPLSGTFTGRLDVAAVDGRLGADVDWSVKNFVVGAALEPIWQEAELKCFAKGSYDYVNDSMTLEQIRLIGATCSADAKGSLANLKSTTDIDLGGMLTYDLEKLEPWLRPILGKDVKIAGRDTRAFKVAGQLYPQRPGKAAPGLSAVAMRFTELKGDAHLHWKSLHTLGCDIGGVEMRAVLQKGWFQFYPIETTLNQGKLRFQPNIRLDPEPIEMILLPGPIIEKAQITPAMCAGAMAYALPMLANVAEAEGILSVSLEGGRLPLSAPTTGELKGTITLHAGKLGAGPILRELSGLLRVPPLIGRIKESKVPFHMIAGKVHHQDLELVFPDFTVKSSGAVGMDGSLALMIDMPIPPQLATALKLTPAQGKQMLRIPIGGTLERPRPDPRALESLTAIVGRSFLENQLNKLLQPKR